MKGARLREKIVRVSTAELIGILETEFQQYGKDAEILPEINLLMTRGSPEGSTIWLRDATLGHAAQRKCANKTRPVT
jgi:hypothetical protein